MYDVGLDIGIKKRKTGLAPPTPSKIAWGIRGCWWMTFSGKIGLHFITGWYVR
jgi:hypothetical protein